MARRTNPYAYVNNGQQPTPYAVNPYSGSSDVPNFNMTLLQTPDIKPIYKDVEGETQVMEYQQKTHEDAQKAYDVQRELQSQVRALDNENHRGILDAENAKLNEIYNDIAETGDYGNMRNRIREGANAYRNNPQLQEVIRANALKQVDFAEIDKRKDIRAEDKAAEKEYYLKNAPKINTDGLPGTYTHSPYQLSAWEEPMTDLAAAFKAYKTPDGKGGFNYRVEDLKNDTGLAGQVLKQWNTKTEYIDEADLQKAMAQYIKSIPKYRQMFQDRDNIGMGGHTEDDFNQWAEMQATGIAGLGHFKDTRVQGSASIVDADGTGGAGAGADDYVAGQSAQSGSGSFTNNVESGRDVKQVAQSRIRYNATADEIVDNMGLVQVGANPSKSIRRKARNATSKSMRDLLSKYENVAAGIEADLQEARVNGDVAKEKELLDKQSKLGSGNFKLANGNDVSYKVYKAEYDRLTKAIESDRAAQARLAEAETTWAKDNGYYNEDDPFNQVNDTKLAKDFTDAVTTNMSSGKMEDLSKSTTDQVTDINEWNSLFTNGAPLEDDANTAFDVGRSVAYHKVKSLSKGSIDDKKKLLKHFQDGIRTLNENGYSTNISDIFSSVYSIIKDEGDNLSKKDYESILMALTMRYTDPSDSQVINNSVGGFVEDYADAIDVTDEILDSASEVTTAGKVTTDPHANPYFGITNNDNLKFDKRTEDSLIKAAKANSNAVLLDDETRLIYNETANGNELDEFEQLDMTNGYSELNAANSTSMNNILKAGFKANYDDATLTYIPGYGNSLAYKIPVTKTIKKGEGKTASDTGESGFIYQLISKDGLHTQALLDKMNTADFKTHAWLFNTKVKTGNSSSYDLAPAFDIAKMGYTKMAINYKNNTIVTKDKNNNIKTHEIDELFDELKANFKFR